MAHPVPLSVYSGRALSVLFFFFFNDASTTEIYTLSLHDALPISYAISNTPAPPLVFEKRSQLSPLSKTDRKSTRLNSSHVSISYAVFCLKKKKTREASDRAGGRCTTDALRHARLV